MSSNYWNDDTDDVANEHISFTVCIPVYNVFNYLKECLDSVFSQDYPIFNVVIIDDGSTDGSAEVCDEYVLNYPEKAIVIHKKNEGLLLARRDAFALATGKYVMSVDSDDMLFPGAISAIAAAIKNTGADVVRFGFARDKDEIDSAVDASRIGVCLIEKKQQKLSALCCSTDGSENPMCFKAIRRECVGTDLDFSGFKGLTFAEDFLQSLTVYDRAETFCRLNIPLYFYRPGSGVTREYNPHFYLDVCKCLNVAEKYASSWEREYHLNGLLTGLAACRLDSAVQYAEWLITKKDYDGLCGLKSSSDFLRCMRLADGSSFLRFDRRLVLSALDKGHYAVIKLIVLLKAARAKVCACL